MANWWEELQKNNSQQSMSLADYGKTFNKNAATLSPAAKPTMYTSTGNAMYRHVGSTASDSGAAELFNVPFRLLSESVTTAGVVAQAVLRDPSRYVGNTTEYKNLWKGAYKASLGDRANKQWWQGGEDPVTIGQMYDALFNADAPDLLDKDAVNKYYETGDLFDSNGRFTPRWQSGSIDLLAMIILDPLNLVGGGGVKAAKGLEALDELSTVAKTVEHYTLQESIEAGLRGSTAAGIPPDVARASETALAQMLREGPRGTVTNTSNPLRRERVRNEIARFASEVDFYDKINLLDDSDSLLKYGSDEYLSSSRILHELFAPIEDVKFPDPSIHGIKDLLGERDFRYFVLDAESFATDGTAIMRWSFEKNRWLPALTFPKLSLKKVMDARASFTENIGNQIKSYDVGDTKVAVSPHVKEMVLGNLTDGPFGTTPDSLLPTGAADAAYKTPDSAFAIPAVDVNGVKVPQPISVGARFGHVIIDGRKVYVLYDTQYNRVYTLQSYRTVKSINAGIEPKAKFEEVDDATIANTDVGETVEGEIIDESPAVYDANMFGAEEDVADFGKDNLFTPETAPRGARVTGVESKQRISANRKLVWVRSDWFDFAKVESYEFKFIDGVTNRIRKVQVPAQFKLANGSEVSNGARPIFIEYKKVPGAFIPKAEQYTVNRSGEIVPVSKAIAEDVAFKNETAVAAKLQADLQADITARLADPEYVNEIRNLHSTPYALEEPRKPVDYSLWYDYTPNNDGTVNISLMARRKEMDGFEDYAEEISSKEFVLHSWNNVPEYVIKRYTYEGYSMYGNRGGSVSPMDKKLDDAGSNLWERTIGNAAEPAVSFNVDDVYRFGYSRPYESRVVKPSIKEGEDLGAARSDAFEKERLAIGARRNRAIKELEYIEKKYPNWESTLADATSLETRWRQVDKELEDAKAILGNGKFENKTGLEKKASLSEKVKILKAEKEDIETKLNSYDYMTEVNAVNSTEIKYAVRAKSLRMYLKYIDSIRPYYVDVNHYLLAYSKGLINRSSDAKRTEQWLLNFEDYLNQTLRTNFSSQKAIENLVNEEEKIVAKPYVGEGNIPTSH